MIIGFFKTYTYSLNYCQKYRCDWNETSRNILTKNTLGNTVQ